MAKPNEIELKRKLGRLVADRRKALNLSQEALAEKINVQTRTLSKIENGHTFFTIKTLCSLCDVFNLSPKSFFDFEDDKSINERKLNEIIDKIENGGNEKIDYYYEIINVIDKRYNK